MSLDHFQKELVRQGEYIKHLTNRVKHVEMLCNIMNIKLLATEIQSNF